MRSTGKLQQTGYIWKQGMEGWKCLADVFPATPAQRATPPASADAPHSIIHYVDQNLTLKNGEAQLGGQAFSTSLISDVLVETDTPIGGLFCLALGTLLFIPAAIHIRGPQDGPFYIASFAAVGILLALFNIINSSSYCRLKVVLRDGSSLELDARDRDYLSKLAYVLRAAAQEAGGVLPAGKR